MLANVVSIVHLLQGFNVWLWQVFLVQMKISDWSFGTGREGCSESLRNGAGFRTVAQPAKGENRSEAAS